MAFPNTQRASVHTPGVPEGWPHQARPPGPRGPHGKSPPQAHSLPRLTPTPGPFPRSHRLLTLAPSQLNPDSTWRDSGLARSCGWGKSREYGVGGPREACKPLKYGAERVHLDTMQMQRPPPPENRLLL